MDCAELKRKVDEYFEIRQLKEIVNAVGQYKNMASEADRNMINRAESFFLKVLGTRRAVIHNRFFQADKKRYSILSRLEKLPAYESACEMTCIICGSVFTYDRKTNLFGYTCLHCRTENAVFPTWLTVEGEE